MEDRLFFKLRVPAWILLLCAVAFGGEAPRQRPTRGYVGGPYKVVAADFTGDGIPDLAVGYHNIDVAAVEQGDGKGRFSRLAIFQIPYDDLPDIYTVYNIAQGDVDGDGLPDLAVNLASNPQVDWRSKDVPEEVLRTLWRGRVVLARNLGQGRFERMCEYSFRSNGTGVNLADLDKDGKLDLLYTARGSGYRGDATLGTLYIRQGLGDWKFGPALEFEAGKSAYYVEVGDLNNDGFLDVVVPNEHADTIQVFVSPGKDVFSRDEKAWTHRVLHASQIPGRRSHAINNARLGDFNGDGNLDLVTANLGTNTISVFPGNGDGTFQRDTLYDGGGGYCAFLDIGDLNNDGHLDFVAAHWAQDTVAVFLNRGDGSFFPGTPYKVDLGCYGVTLCDADRDGDLDVVTANYRARSISLLKGNGDGTFQAAVTLPRGLRLDGGKWVPEKAK